MKGVRGTGCKQTRRMGQLAPAKTGIGARQLKPRLPIAVDGTSRHEASYVHCTLGGTASPN